MYQFYDHQLRNDLFTSTQSRHPGQQVAITLANFFEYQADCKNGTREASAEATRQYQKAILQACIDYCAQNTTFVATLEKKPPREQDFQLQETIGQELHNFEMGFNLNPSEMGMITEVNEPLGMADPEKMADPQESERQQMQDFLKNSGAFPYSGTLFIQNLIHIAGLPNLGTGSIEASTIDYVSVGNDEVITREEVTTDALPVLEINSDGENIPDCFARTCQYFRCREVDPQADTSAGYVKESGEPYSGEIPARATTTREYILKPVRPGSRFFIQFYSGGLSQEDTRRIIESTANPFTCSSLLNKAHMDAEIDGILCFCGDFAEFHHKYLQKVEDGWLIFDETGQQ